MIGSPMPKISAAELFDDNRAKLRLEWIAGRGGGGRELDNEHLRDSREGLIGHLNFIHANWIQVIGRTEFAHLNSLAPDARQRTLQQIKASELACMIVADGEKAPDYLTALAESINVPLYSTPFESMELMWMLRPYLARALAVSTTMHGVFLDVLGMGVMLTGDSGVGKSELALELISRGSGLIADDVVELFRIAPETLEGRCPALLKDFLEVRGLGVLNSEMYNDFASDTDIQNAIDDMLSAIDYVSQKGSFIKAQAVVMRNADRSISERVSNLNKEIDSITREELDDNAARNKAVSLKASLVVNNINLVAQHNTSLVQNLLDMTQGLSKAPGVFGSMGF